MMVTTIELKCRAPAVLQHVRRVVKIRSKGGLSLVITGRREDKDFWDSSEINYLQIM